MRTATTQDYGDLEILVSDNFSADGTRDVVLGFADPRIRYLNTGSRLSMSHNWEFALSHVTGDWVTIIGDDDGLLPGSVSEIAQIIRSAGVRAIRSRVCSYQWPSLTGRSFGHLAVPLRSGSEMRSTRVWLDRVLAGFATYLELPMLYNGGFVEVSVLNELRARTGSVYRSSIPDVYSAISISSVLDRYLYLQSPLAINGASKHSTGTSQFSRDQNSKNSPSKIFASEGNIPFHDDIPLRADGSLPPSLHAFVYESYLQTLDLRASAPQDMHARQLQVILATSPPRDPAVRDWSETFAAMHHLDLEGIRAQAGRRRWRYGIERYRAVLGESVNTWGVGSESDPIKTVYEASLTARSILADPHRRLRNLSRLVRRLKEKGLGAG